ncbi:hypothetical protein VU12_07690 [Desulfobulbus sp. US4]|nr:hypothetical protein [Desulfobulbus sp. US4]
MWNRTVVPMPGPARPEGGDPHQRHRTPFQSRVITPQQVGGHTVGATGTYQA